jgi:glycosyltransferase involved in cell wall biosynthesis
MNGLDLHVLSSIGESFPNTVAEAMACGTPCVVNDVGDAKLIVGDTGWVAPPGNPGLLAEKLLEALSHLERAGKAGLGTACRARIQDNFSLTRMVESYEQLWARTAMRKG